MRKDNGDWKTMQRDKEAKGELTSSAPDGAADRNAGDDTSKTAIPRHIFFSVLSAYFFFPLFIYLF